MKLSFLLPITQETGIRLTDTGYALRYLRQTIDSVFKQSIPNWELVVIVERSLLSKVKPILDEQSQQSTELVSHISKQLKVLVSNSKNAAAACNFGLEKATGQFIAVIQAGDMLASQTSYELLKCIAENAKAQFIYTDHDHIDLLGQRFKPFFKPDLSPDLLYCQNYINNLVLIKKTLLKKLGGWDTRYGSAYGYALNLNAIGNLVNLDRPNPKLLGKQSPIKHIPKILYHERVKVKVDLRKNKLIELKPNKIDEKKQSKQGLAVIKQFFKDQKRNASVKQIKPKLYRHHWSIPKPEPLVSLIIPTRDGYDILKTCVESILKKTTYKNYEILIVDNQSSESKAIQYMQNLENNYQNIRILKYNKPFNYSAINNYAITQSKGEILGLINNDTEVITPNWLTEMVSHAIRPEIGAVGAMLYYPDGSIQHAGVKIEGRIVDNDFKGENKEKNQNFNLLESIRNPPAVTAAALIIKKLSFSQVGGLDEDKFKIEFNDVDLCLNLIVNNKINIWLCHIELLHYESKTRDKMSCKSKNDYSNILKKINSLKILKV